MCGIFGTVNLRKEEQAEDDLRTFKYRGPDDTGYVYDKNVFIGNNRLSVIDIRDCSNQPLISADKKVSLVFNGEIYNYKAVRAELESSGVSFVTDSDTEVVLKTYEHWGKDGLCRLSGMFALALHDKNRMEIILARDKAGMKPLYYYYELGKGISFSSEMKGLIPSVTQPSLSRLSFKLATALGYVPSPLTLYDNVFKLERGKMLTYDINTHKISSIVTILDHKTEPVCNLIDLKETIEQSVLSHLVSDAPVGLFFSGGNDSALIAAVLNKYGVSLKTYSIILDNKPEDQKYINSIGEQLGLKPTKLIFGTDKFDESLEVVDDLIDEPTLDSSMLAIYSLAKRASEDVKVVLSGEGADEYFFGYERHLQLATLGSSACSINTDLIEKLPITQSSKVRLLKKMSIVLSGGYTNYLCQINKSSSFVGWKEATDIFKRSGLKPLHLDQAFYLENDLLRKMDFATSYASVEGRMPFLDPTVISASINFESNLTEKNVTKYALKEILASYIGREKAYRSKSGLGLPQVQLFKSSGIYRERLQVAVTELSKIPEFDGLLPECEVEKLCDRYPYYSFLLYTYWCSIRNLKRHHER